MTDLFCDTPATPKILTLSFSRFYWMLHCSASTLSKILILIVIQLMEKATTQQLADEVKEVNEKVLQYIDFYKKL